MKEIFVGIFENDQDNPLNYLDQERDKINDLFLNHIDTFNAPLLKDAGIKGFMGNLEKLTNEMTIFHFSGHHNDKAQTLKLSDDIFRNQGLIKILNASPKLKMVFINGCSTGEIVDALHNVPIVIGTKTPVYDSFAQQFSVRLYNLLLANKENLTNSDFIKSIYHQTIGFFEGYFEDPDDTERGVMSLEELTKKTNNYIIKINKDTAANFDQRVTYNSNPGNYPLKSKFKELVNEIKENEKLTEDLYKYYPYFLCIHLEILSEFNDINNSVYQELSKERYWVIRSLFKEFLNFLKFSAYSIIWSISKEHGNEFTIKLSNQLKEILRENLEIAWESHVQDKISEDLAFIYSNIPDDYITKNELWIDLKHCVLEHRNIFKEISDFFSAHENNDIDTHDYMRTELYLHEFIRKFKFLRSLGIESIYDVFYNQFRYNKQRSYVINRSYYPVSNRPIALDEQKSVVYNINDNEPGFDIDIHSVYLCTVANDNGALKRELNLSPFYLDVNSTSVAKDKIKLYYLDRYSEATEKLIYKEVVNAKVYRQNNGVQKDLGEEIEVPLEESMIWALYKDGKENIIQIEEKKKIRDHFGYIKNLIASS